MSLTGKPLLANDPHRPIQMPSLRKTVHLVAPGLNVIGAGEPALPGIALGHNELVGFGFTIVGTDQQDLYVEELNPANPLEYRYKGAWRKMEVERDSIAVKGAAARVVELKYTVHGPVIFEDGKRAFALKWVGAEPGGAGYLPALTLMRAKNWTEFRAGAARYKVPSENMVYADRAGNIGWIAAGWAPVRKNWNGLLPVPGASGEYEWQGYLGIADHPQRFNPKEHFIATANAKILPEQYPHMLAYEWAQPFRLERVLEMLAGRTRLTVAQMAEMQSDVVSLPARRLQAVLRRTAPAGADKVKAMYKRITDWDAALRTDSTEALAFEVWMTKLGPALFGPDLGARVEWIQVLRTLEADPARHAKTLIATLESSIAELEKAFGADPARWHWGRVHQVQFRHSLGKANWNRGPFARPGDAQTVNATSGTSFRQTAGASFRMVLDPSNWDNSVITNVPGESGNPESKHYDDLIRSWSVGKHHPLPYTRRAVEAAAVERIRLTPR
jgi:penicillin amidase